MTRIALVGDYSESVVAHRAIPIALKLACAAARVDVSWDWVPSRTLVDASEQLQSFAGVWCVPGSPYANTRGVLDAIRFARITRRPFLGTCGGFQHAVLEFAEAEWGVRATHAETDPTAVDPVIAPLTCSLINVSNTLHFEPHSQLANIYSGPSDEEYQCRFGLNPLYESRLLAGPVRIAARDAEGGVRAIELDNHPFFIGTLFQPERAALRDRLPPLVKAFVVAVAAAN